MMDRAETQKMPKRLEGDFDYIVVGAGTAGCIVANRLSADPRKRVLILEAGGSDNWIWFHIPVGYLFAIGNPRSDWMFRTEPEAGLNGRSLAYPRGKVIGGSSAINAMISMRGQAADYDHWRQLGLGGWGWDDVKPAFRHLEDHFLGESEQHGTGGGWRIEAPRVFRARFSEARAEAAQSSPRERRAGGSADHRAGARRRGALHSGRRSRRGPRQGRGDPVRRLDRIDSSVAPIGHRPGRLARAAWDRDCARPPRRRPQSAGPSAAACDLQGHGRAHAQRDLLFAAEARPDGPRLRIPPPWAADHGAVAAWHFHPIGPAPRARQYPVPRSAAVAGQVRRSAAPLSGDHGERMQFAADLARHRADSLGPGRRGAFDRAELSIDRRGPSGCRRCHPHHAAAEEAAGAGALSPRRISARPRGGR